MHYIFDFGPVLAAWPELANGAILTLKISSTSMILGLLLGIVFMLMRMSSVKAISFVAFCYI